MVSEEGKQVGWGRERDGERGGEREGGRGRKRGGERGREGEREGGRVRERGGGEREREREGGKGHRLPVYLVLLREWYLDNCRCKFQNFSA